METQAKYEVGLIPQDNLMPALTPDEQVDKASVMAKVLQRVVKQANLSRKFGGEKEHLFFEAWQTIGQFFSCTPQTEWTKPIMDGEKLVGYEARVNVVNSEGRVIACAESMCMRDEPNWRNKPLYALRSMAQTRTAGKALRSVFAWVAVLAGYSGTPAEEMSDDIPDSKPPKEPTKKAPSKFDFLKVMGNMKKELGEDVYYEILGGQGYTHANEITERDKQVAVYKVMMASLTAPQGDQA
jgi:hypothetical protein